LAIEYRIVANKSSAVRRFCSFNVLHYAAA